MIDNPTLRAIRDRRSIRNFTADPVTDEQIETILEAARWAPSGRNSQPCDFVVVRDPGVRSGLGAILRRTTFAWGGLSSAPVMIVVAVDPTRDPEHFVEDGAVAAQNMCLAAQSIGLGSSWAGVYSPRKTRNGVEAAISSLIGLPSAHRAIAVVPIGVAMHSKTTNRRPLAEMVHYDRFSSHPDSRPVWRDEETTDADDGTRGIPAAAVRQSITQPGRFS
ncbi:MAG: nitroreductase family protein [Acidimicrobiia bacterium]|nr:nitroreductase family protein [Acidimicrobiia bacterium]